MKHKVLALVLLTVVALGTQSAVAQSTDFAWAVRAGGDVVFDGDADTGQDIDVDGDGNILIVGMFRGTADFDGTTVSAVGILMSRVPP